MSYQEAPHYVRFGEPLPKILPGDLHQRGYFTPSYLRELLERQNGKVFDTSPLSQANLQ